MWQKPEQGMYAFSNIGVIFRGEGQSVILQGVSDSTQSSYQLMVLQQSAKVLQQAS